MLDDTALVSYISGGTKQSHGDEVRAKAKRDGGISLLPATGHWPHLTFVARTPVRSLVEVTARAQPALTAHLTHSG